MKRPVAFPVQWSRTPPGKLTDDPSLKHRAKKEDDMKPKKWEGSAQDKRMDKAGAKKAGVSMKKWEGSKADEKMDARMKMKGVRSTTKNSRY